MDGWRPTRPVIRKAVFALVVVLVVGIGGPLLRDWWQERQDRCAEGVVRRGPQRECVGVSDGVADTKFAFTGDLKEVQQKIGAENRRLVEDKENYVTVVYMTSLTVKKDDSNSEAAVKRQLQGAYLAQHRANQGDLSGAPKIRLLVANTGSGAAQWEYTVDRLIRLSTSKDRRERLLAVMGLGPSTDRNRQAMRRLSQHGIAMVASTMSATNLTDIPGLVRVAPTNRDEARAASQYLKAKGFKSSVIVQDEAEANLYARTLAVEFVREFPDRQGHKLLAETAGYDASKPDSWENELYWITRTLCDQKPDVVYFAGRGKQLMAFINSLSNRTCQDQDFTVMTGDDTTNLTPSQLRAAAEKGIAVLSTALAHPDMWQKDKDSVSESSAGFFREGGWMSEQFPSDPRDDGQAIMAHDATLTAIRGIRMASREGDALTSDSVARMFRQMRGTTQRVEGASGFLSFRNNGDPIDKAIPVLRLEKDGRFKLDDVVRGSSR
jgi:ABC-type branched-subunit amino acid transport system substrate-binding protein